MYRLKTIKIEGFWGEHIIETSMNEDVNIFIGRNGTGKTTLINLLQAVLTVDIDLLYNLQYNTITLYLNEKRSKRKIEVHKLSDELDYNSVVYKIGNTKYKLPEISYNESISKRFKTGRINSKFYHLIKQIRESLNGILKISYLSVYRENFVYDEPFIDSRREYITNSIDSKLEELLGDLTSYQLQLETEMTKYSKGFQENVLKTMLFNENFDHVNISQKIDLNIKSIRVGLKQAYRELKILDEKTSTQIENHINAISKAAESINKHVLDKSQGLYPNDVTPLTVLKRTERIIELSSQLEENKKKIIKPIDEYLNIINEFNENKQFKLNEDSEGGLTVYKDGSKIPIDQLSSGEKQLIILLTETLLQKQSQTIFIADEPELSLHIEWQRKIIPSIKKLNPNAQIIVATHSPEIVGKWRKNTINMEDILYG